MAAKTTRRRLDSGAVTGIRLEGVEAFLGIPFASPPIGDLRWRQPVSVKPWTHERECAEFKASCPQPETIMYDVGRKDEDCLHLNVWTPSQRGAKLPVMVWIHGGAFVTGSASVALYNGANIAKNGVVVVSMNYRLGPLGFLSHPALSEESEKGISGNYGIYDQIFALEWVQRNIEEFGGDPRQVTLFGESAGGSSVCILLTSSLSNDLFHRAIIESAPLWVREGLPAAIHSMKTAEETGIKLSSMLGVKDEDDALACMRETSANELIVAAQPEEKFYSRGLQFGPVVDGYLLTDHPAQVFKEGKQKQIPVLIGSNEDEANLFLEGVDIPEKQVDYIIGRLFKSLSGEVKRIFPKDRIRDIRRALGKIITVSEFTAPARFISRCVSEQESDAFLYSFARYPEGWTLGACHGIEISYLFGNLDPSIGFQDIDYEISRIMQGYWVNFARHGDPNGENLPHWPSFRNDKRQHQRFNSEVTPEPWEYERLCAIAEMIHI